MAFSIDSRKIVTVAGDKRQIKRQRLKKLAQCTDILFCIYTYTRKCIYGHVEAGRY